MVPIKHNSSAENERDKMHLDTSGWKFIEEETSDKKYISPHEMISSLKIRSNKLKELNQMLETEMQMIAAEETDQEQHCNGSLRSDEIFQKATKDNLFRNEKTQEIEEKLMNLKHSEVESNPYLVLLNRLDEEEGVRIPSIEDKLKLAENRLRLSMQEFCSACEDLITIDDQAKSDEEFLQPKLVSKALRPKAYDPSLLPPRTLHVAELETKAKISDNTINKTGKKIEKQERESRLLKQNFWSPPKTWFSCEREEPTLTEEEIELLNSTSTKDFLKFLRDRKKDTPKIIQDIQDKVKNIKKEKKETKE